ncbi:MAG: molybdopterin-dependent oxidoreductase [Coriobacteriales bacterium]|nr:molybdopterin-dependent oxidoreductase [Coriobacteriales bacterium]
MLDKSLSRRSFFKVAAATAGAVALAGGHVRNVLEDTAYAAPEATQDEVKIIHSTCRGCGKMECGNLITVRNGRVVHLEGDHRAVATRGNLCVKGRSATQALYHPDRIRYPLIRTTPKGEDPKWKRVSHAEAIQYMADGFNSVIEKYGQHSIKCLHGTGRITTYATEAYPTYLIQTANTGSPAGILCKGPRLSSAAMICFPGAHWCNLIDGQKVNFQWGTNQEVSNYDNSCRVTVDEHVRAETTICVGPRMQNLGKEADIWIDLRPGTDDAVALGLLHQAVFNPNCHIDMMFVKKWTNAPFLYVEDMEPSGWTWCEWDKIEGKQEMGYYPLNIRTRILKESDLVEGGNVRKMAVWDTKSNGIVFFDTQTCLWDGQTEYQYPDLEKDCVEYKGGILAKDPGFPVDIDPAIEGSFQVTLKDGRTVTAEPVWEMFKRHLAPWTPEHTEEITGVFAQKFIDAAEAYCEEPGKGGIVFNLPLEHVGNSIQTTMLPLILSALMNNIDSPGGQRGCENMFFTMDTFFQYHIPWANNTLDPKEQAKVVGGDRFPLTPFFQMVGGAALYHDPISAAEAILYDDPYPLRAMISNSGQHFNSGNAWMNWQAFETLDFFGGWELWHSPTIELADVVMPAAHFLEVSVLRYTQGGEGAIGAQVQAVKRQGDASWDSADICCELSKAMGYEYWPTQNRPLPQWPDEWLKPWPTERDMLNMSVLPMRRKLPAKIGGIDGIQIADHLDIAVPAPDGNILRCDDWDEYVEQYQKHSQWNLKEISPFGYYYRFQWGHFRPRDSANPFAPKVPGFNTPTGKFEILSTILESYHGPNTQWVEAPGSYNGIPGYREPVESPFSSPELYKEYPIIVTTGRRNPLYFHNEGRQQPWLRELTPCATFQIHPDTAAELGIEQGDWCWIETKRGRIRQVADLFYGIRPGTVECDHQWWYPELSAPKHGWDLSNVNVLVSMDHESQDPIIGTCNCRGYLAKIYKATPENSPFGNPCPCDDDGTEIIHTATDPRLKEWLPTYEYEVI